MALLYFHKVFQTKIRNSLENDFVKLDTLGSFIYFASPLYTCVNKIKELNVDKYIMNHQENNEVEKKGRGRPSTHHLDKENYYTEYYRLRSYNVQCGCGIIVVSHNMKRHQRSLQHFNQLKFLEDKFRKIESE